MKSSKRPSSKLQRSTKGQTPKAKEQSSGASGIDRTQSEANVASPAEAPEKPLNAHWLRAVIQIPDTAKNRGLIMGIRNAIQRASEGIDNNGAIIKTEVIVLLTVDLPDRDSALRTPHSAMGKGDA